MIKTGRRIHLIVIMLSLAAVTARAGQTPECQQATQLVIEAFDLGYAPEHFAEQIRLLQEALGLCPQHPEAHNNLASIFEAQEDYDQALAQYQAAVQANPDFAAAWFGLGEVYYKTGRYPLSLDAYLRACQDQDARARIEELLSSQRYRSSEAGDVVDKESLLLLFDPQRRAQMNAMLRDCRITTRSDSGVLRGVEVEAAVDFRNILFDLGQATLKAASQRQLREIAAALLELGRAADILISGHTDTQPFAGHTVEESFDLNMQLSKDRAAAVAAALIQLGVPAERITTQGYGSTQPDIDADTPEAYARNRRVTIEVR